MSASASAAMAAASGWQAVSQVPPPPEPDLMMSVPRQRYAVLEQLSWEQIEELQREFDLRIDWPAGAQEIPLLSRLDDNDSRPKLSLGRGGFGIFTVGIHQQVGGPKLVGIKVSQTTPDRVPQLGQLKNLPNVLAVNDTWFHEGLCYQAMDIAGLGPVDRIQKQIAEQTDEDFRDMLIYWIANGLLEGLRRLRKDGYSHLDVKLSNLVLGRNADPKLIDFDTMTQLESGNFSSGEVNGDARFFPPERWMSTWGEYATIDGEKVDVWAAGISLLCLLDSEFHGIDFTQPEKALDGCGGNIKPVIESIMSQLEPRLSGDRPIFAFIRRLLHPDPSRRPTLREALEDNWISTQERASRDFHTSIKDTLRALSSSRKLGEIHDDQSSYRRGSTRLTSPPATDGYAATRFHPPSCRSFKPWISENHVNRSSLDDTLQRFLRDESASQIFVSGLSGSGKTHLVRGAIEEHVQRGQRVAWIDLSGPSSAQSSLRQLATELAYPSLDLKAAWFRDLWIVYDQVNDLSQVSRYLPQNGKSIVIFNRPHLASHTHHLRLKTLHGAERRQLFEKVARREADFPLPPYPSLVLHAAAMCRCSRSPESRDELERQIPISEAPKQQSSYWEVSRRWLDLTSPSLQALPYSSHVVSIPQLGFRGSLLDLEEKQRQSMPPEWGLLLNFVSIFNAGPSESDMQQVLPNPERSTFDELKEWKVLTQHPEEKFLVAPRSLVHRSEDEVFRALNLVPSHWTLSDSKPLVRLATSAARLRGAEASERISRSVDLLVGALLNHFLSQGRMDAALKGWEWAQRSPDLPFSSQSASLSYAAWRLGQERSDVRLQREGCESLLGLLTHHASETASELPVIGQDRSTLLTQCLDLVGTQGDGDDAKLREARFYALYELDRLDEAKRVLDEVLASRSQGLPSSGGAAAAAAMARPYHAPPEILLRAIQISHRLKDGNTVEALESWFAVVRHLGADEIRAQVASDPEMENLPERIGEWISDVELQDMPHLAAHPSKVISWSESHPELSQFRRTLLATQILEFSDPVPADGLPRLRDFARDCKNIELRTVLLLFSEPSLDPDGARLLLKTGGGPLRDVLFDGLDTDQQQFTRATIARCFIRDDEASDEIRALHRPPEPPDPAADHIDYQVFFKMLKSCRFPTRFLPNYVRRLAEGVLKSDHWTHNRQIELVSRAVQTLDDDTKRDLIPILRQRLLRHAQPGWSDRMVALYLNMSFSTDQTLRSHQLREMIHALERSGGRLREGGQFSSADCALVLGHALDAVEPRERELHYPPLLMHFDRVVPNQKKFSAQWWQRFSNDASQPDLKRSYYERYLEALLGVEDASDEKKGSAASYSVLTGARQEFLAHFHSQAGNCETAIHLRIALMKAGTRIDDSGLTEFQSDLEKIGDAATSKQWGWLGIALLEQGRVPEGNAALDRALTTLYDTPKAFTQLLKGCNQRSLWAHAIGLGLKKPEDLLQHEPLLEIEYHDAMAASYTGLGNDAMAERHSSEADRLRAMQTSPSAGRT